MDKTSTFGAKVSYDFRRWLLLGAEYTHTDRNSTLNIDNYKRNLFVLTVGATPVKPCLAAPAGAAIIGVLAILSSP